MPLGMAHPLFHLIVLTQEALLEVGKEEGGEDGEEMEITWEPGLKERTEELVKKKRGEAMAE